MAPPLVSPQARADIAGTWDATVDRRGRAQAVECIRRTEAAFVILAGDPETGRPCDEIRPGYRLYRIGSHMLFYRIGAGTADVVRILHARMDFRRHL